MRDRVKKEDKKQNEATSVELLRSQSSVEIKNDGKGKLAVNLKTYADTASEAVDVALENFKRLNKELEGGE